MNTFTHYPLDELKLIYNLLWIQALTNKTLVTSVFLQDLQDYLLAQATAEGINVTELTEWTRWLTQV
jgi:hypothetical protein